MLPLKGIMLYVMKTYWSFKQKSETVNVLLLLEDYYHILINKNEIELNCNILFLLNKRKKSCGKYIYIFITFRIIFKTFDDVFL